MAPTNKAPLGGTKAPKEDVRAEPQSSTIPPTAPPALVVPAINDDPAPMTASSVTSPAPFGPPINAGPAPGTTSPISLPAVVALFIDEGPASITTSATGSPTLVPPTVNEGPTYTMTPDLELQAQDTALPQLVNGPSSTEHSFSPQRLPSPPSSVQLPESAFEPVLPFVEHEEAVVALATTSQIADVDVQMLDAVPSTPQTGAQTPDVDAQMPSSFPPTPQTEVPVTTTPPGTPTPSIISPSTRNILKTQYVVFQFRRPYSIETEFC